jgi:hypothetical protein
MVLMKLAWMNSMNKLNSQQNLVYLLLLILTLSFMTINSFEVKLVQAQSRFSYVDPSSVLPWTGLGADYLLYYNNQDVTVWTQTEFMRDGVWYYGHVDLVNYWKPLFHIAKLGFTFPYENQICSYYDYRKMNDVVDLFFERGTRVIPALYPRWDSEAYVGSEKLAQDWITFTYDFLDDDRIAAFNIFGEPVGQSGEKATDLRQWHPEMQEDRNSVLQYFVDLINSIHNIDPNRVVIFPFLGLSYWNQHELISDLEGTGMLENPNVIFDIIHPYYFQRSEWNEGTPAQKVTMYENQFILPWINRLPSNRLWCGETFCFSAPVSETHYADPIRSLQIDFMKNMINVFVEYKIGFIFWDSLAYPPYYTAPNQVFSLADAHIESVETSNYGVTYVETTPSPIPSATPSPSPSPIPSATPSPSPSPIPSATPSPSPSPIPSASPEPSLVPLPSPSPTLAPSPVPSKTTELDSVLESLLRSPLKPPLASDRWREYLRYGYFVRFVRF